jgi:hypothetical protein
MPPYPLSATQSPDNHNLGSGAPTSICRYFTIGLAYASPLMAHQAAALFVIRLVVFRIAFVFTAAGCLESKFNQINH